MLGLTFFVVKTWIKRNLQPFGRLRVGRQGELRWSSDDSLSPAESRCCLPPEGGRRRSPELCLARGELHRILRHSPWPLLLLFIIESPASSHAHMPLQTATHITGPRSTARLARRGAARRATVATGVTFSFTRDTPGEQEEQEAEEVAAVAGSVRLEKLIRGRCGSSSSATTATTATSARYVKYGSARASGERFRRASFCCWCYAPLRRSA